MRFVSFIVSSHSLLHISAKFTNKNKETHHIVHIHTSTHTFVIKIRQTRRRRRFARQLENRASNDRRLYAHHVWIGADLREYWTFVIRTQNEKPTNYCISLHNPRFHRVHRDRRHGKSRLLCVSQSKEHWALSTIYIKRRISRVANNGEYARCKPRAYALPFGTWKIGLSRSTSSLSLYAFSRPRGSLNGWAAGCACTSWVLLQQHYRRYCIVLKF